MKWYEATADALHPGQTYTHADLVVLLKQGYPYVSANSYQWALQDMLKSGRIVKIGYNQYQVPGAETKSEYSPCYSELAQELIRKLDGHSPDIRFVLIETALINEFLDSPVGMNVLIIQTEKDKEMAVFRYLQEQGYPGLMYRPMRKIYDLYRTQNCILIADLVSESPTNRKQPHAVCIEKLLVDMMCDKYVGWAYDNAGFKPAFECAAGRYLIDKPRLLRYANRRGKKNEIIMTLPGFMNEGLIEAAKNDRQNDLVYAAAEIIQSLPDSQQELYRDINGGKQTQADMARYYDVTPQAITNRISRLYNTVSRRLQEEYGFSENEIKKIGGGNAMSFFRNIWL